MNKNYLDDGLLEVAERRRALQSPNPTPTGEPKQQREPIQMTEQQVQPFLSTVGRRLYIRTDGNAVLVHQLESGKLLRIDTLEEFIPDETWEHRESWPESASYVLLLTWTDSKWGETCIALFGSPEDANQFVARMNIGRHCQQKVRMVR